MQSAVLRGVATGRGRNATRRRRPARGHKQAGCCRNRRKQRKHHQKTMTALSPAPSASQVRGFWCDHAGTQHLVLPAGARAANLALHLYACDQRWTSARKWHAPSCPEHSARRTWRVTFACPQQPRRTERPYSPLQTGGQLLMARSLV